MEEEKDRADRNMPPPIDAAATRDWLARAASGHCGETAFDDEGDCEIGVQGSFSLDALVWQPRSWDIAAGACLARCGACARCRFVSISLEHSDCSWFSTCDNSLSNKPPGFRSARLDLPGRPVAAPLPSWLSHANSSARPPFVYAFSRRGHSLHKPERWLSASTPGACVRASDAPLDAKCSSVGGGLLPLLPDHPPPHNWSDIASRCLERCAACERCTHGWLSVRLSPPSCQWSTSCDPLALHAEMGFDRFRTAAYAAAHHKPAAASVAAAPLQAASPVARHEFGFFVSVYRAPCAVRRLVASVRAVYGEDAPLYVHTDNARPARGLGGLNFSRLCAVLGCEWSFSEDAAGQPSAYQASGLAYAQVASQMRPEGEPEP